MNHREFEELCSEYERRIRDTGVDANTVTEFFQHCRNLNADGQSN